MRSISYIIIVLLSITVLTSCKKDFDAGGTVASKVANGWWVNYFEGGSDIGFGTTFFETYNTTENDDSIWVDDLGNGFGFKCKAFANYKTLSFSADSSFSTSYPAEYSSFFGDTTSFVTIIGGKVLPRAAHPPSGYPADSINMTITFGDDPADTFVIAGYSRTGFIEDDH